MKKEDYRKVRYFGNGKHAEGLFHTLVKQVEENGDEFYKVLVETDDGKLIYLPSSSIQFIDQGPEM